MLYGLQMDIVTDHLNKNDKKKRAQEERGRCLLWTVLSLLQFSGIPGEGSSPLIEFPPSSYPGTTLTTTCTATLAPPLQSLLKCCWVVVVLWKGGWGSFLFNPAHDCAIFCRGNFPRFSRLRFTKVDGFVFSFQFLAMNNRFMFFSLSFRQSCIFVCLYKRLH